jgi:hypothetical protein
LDSIASTCRWTYPLEGAAFGQLPPEGWLHAVATIWKARTLRLLSVVSAVCVQLTLTVNPAKEPPSEERCVGEAGQAGICTGEQLSGFSVLPGSSTWCAPHSMPARALW